MRGSLIGLVVFFALAFCVGAEANEAAHPVPKLAQKMLQRFDVPGTTYETIVLRVEFPPNYAVSRHSHPGPQASYILFGEMTYLFDGEAPATRVAGESKDLAGYAIHSGKAGPNGAILLNTYVIEKGKPLSIQAETSAP
jgi:quercetin dioxygenase-like cupin family protein